MSTAQADTEMRRHIQSYCSRSAGKREVEELPPVSLPIPYEQEDKFMALIPRANSKMVPNYLGGFRVCATATKMEKNHSSHLPTLSYA